MLLLGTFSLDLLIVRADSASINDHFWQTHLAYCCFSPLLLTHSLHFCIAASCMEEITGRTISLVRSFFHFCFCPFILTVCNNSAFSGVGVFSDKIRISHQTHQPRQYTCTGRTHIHVHREFLSLPIPLL